MRKQTAVILTWAMVAAGAVTACGQSGSSTAVTAAAETENETEGAKVPETRTVMDAEGNEVTIPYEVTKAAPSIGAFAQVTEMLAPGKISATSTAQISDYFKEIFPDYVESNPNNYDTGSVEDLIASGTQVVYGASTIYSEEQLAQLDAAGIAHVSVSNLSDSAGMMESYRLIGEILGEDAAERAEEFCAYWQGSIDDCQDRTKDLSDEERVKVLRLSVSGGAYSTVNNTDIFTSIVKEAGGINVAADYQTESADGSITGEKGGNDNGGAGSSKAGSGNGENSSGNNGRAGGETGGQSSRGNGGKRAAGGPNSGLSLDAEQIIAWDPEVIIGMNKEGVEAILSDPALANVKAVREGKVYNTPQGIYLWGVRSGENAMMTPWLGTILYPDLFADVDMEQVVMDFFKEWYHTDIDAATAQSILEGK